MHVLITNDDGPPGSASPYFHYFIEALKKYTDWKVSVVVPHVQRSWIGKAHLMGHDITASYIYPGKINEPYDGPYDSPQSGRSDGQEPWVLLDGTPASCANIGVAHLFKDKGPIDLVISGPNYGKNCTALYIMSSGTVGAAMEASLCGVKSIGLSFSFKQKFKHNPVHITEASKIATQLVGKLYEEWSSDVQLYTVNIPLCDSLNENTKIYYASILENKWGASYDDGIQSQDGKTTFKWNPDFAACQKSIDESSPGNDGWVVNNDMISVTPLRASFKEVPGFAGTEIKLNDTIDSGTCVVVQLADNHYLYPLWKKALEKHSLPMQREYTGQKRLVHYCDYDDLDFDRIGADPDYMGCSFVYRKGLIRKHYMNNTILTYVTKNPQSCLKNAYPDSYNLEVDYAEFLDDSLDEAYELRHEIETSDKQWILKPSMSDRAQGIRLFSTVEQLQEIFDEFDEGVVTDDEDEDNNDDNRGVVVSQMRHFVVQRYISNPLLLPRHDNRKFHIRTYVLCVGSLKVYVYRDMLALFALKPYTPPPADGKPTTSDLDCHLTNTCIQGSAADDQSVYRLTNIKGVTDENKQRIIDQIYQLTGELFKAAATVDQINFQSLPNTFEFYGLDFMVDSDYHVSVLEVNAYPDFKQTGDDLKGLVDGLIEATVDTAVLPFFGKQQQINDKLISVLDYTGHSW